MSYKEIQVPNETVRAVYEKFYVECGFLVPKEEDKNSHQRKIDDEFQNKEKVLREEYFNLTGETSYYLDYFRIPSFKLFYPARDAFEEARTMLDALKYSEGSLTMTQGQVTRMNEIESGDVIKSIERHIDNDFYYPESRYLPLIEAWIAVQEKPTPVSVVKTKEVDLQDEPGASFGGAIVAAILLFGLVMVLLKSCG